MLRRTNRVDESFHIYHSKLLLSMQVEEFQGCRGFSAVVVLNIFEKYVILFFILDFVVDLIFTFTYRVQISKKTQKIKSTFAL